MSYNFFTYESRLPEGAGFGMFGSRHVLWLSALGLFSFCLLRLYRRLPESGKRVWERAVAFSTAALIVVRCIYVAAVNAPFLYELSIHLCSVTGALCALHCVTAAEWAGQVIYAIGLPGTVLALMFPDWGSYPAVHFVTAEGFLFHTGIVLYAAGQLYSRRITPDRKKLWQVFAFLAAYMAPVYVFDRAFGVNYMFLNNPSDGSPLELLLRLFGKNGYLPAYVLLILLCVYVMVACYGRLRR